MNWTKLFTITKLLQRITGSVRKCDKPLREHHLYVLCINISVGIQQQTNDGGIASKHGPVQGCIFMIFVTQVDRDIKGQ